jgi:hypothetical protein
MKLHTWRCKRCGFVWCEPVDSRKCMDHGCPRGCDDAGKVIDTVEATDTNGQWICWVLSKGDIDSAVKKLRLMPSKLTQNNYEAITKTFIKGFEWAKEEWSGILEDAVKEIMR